MPVLPSSSQYSVSLINSLRVVCQPPLAASWSSLSCLCPELAYQATLIGLDKPRQRQLNSARTQITVALHSVPSVARALNRYPCDFRLFFRHKICALWLNHEKVLKPVLFVQNGPALKSAPPPEKPLELSALMAFRQNCQMSATMPCISFCFLVKSQDAISVILSFCQRPCPKTSFHLKGHRQPPRLHHLSCSALSKATACTWHSSHEGDIHLCSLQTRAVQPFSRSATLSIFLPSSVRAVAAMWEAERPASASWSVWLPCSMKRSGSIIGRNFRPPSNNPSSASECITATSQNKTPTSTPFSHAQGSHIQSNVTISAAHFTGLTLHSNASSSKDWLKGYTA